MKLRKTHGMSYCNVLFTRKFFHRWGFMQLPSSKFGGITIHVDIYPSYVMGVNFVSSPMSSLKAKKKLMWAWKNVYGNMGWNGIEE